MTAALPRTMRSLLALLTLLALSILPLGGCEDPKGLHARTIDALTRRLADADRGVRYAAAMALGKAGQQQRLAAVEKDPAWCVRAEAAWWRAGGPKKALLPAHVPARLPPTPRWPVRHTARELDPTLWSDRIHRIERAPKDEAGIRAVTERLLDPVYSVRAAAFEALRRRGPEIAVPVAEVMARGDYGALHHGVQLFDDLGADGADAVPVFTEMLRADDVNVREAAARALWFIGPRARAAIPALVDCLAHERLSVVSRAALALGRTGLSEALLATLSHADARVRAYGAFALGWALGETRRLDQVPFEPRLPVLAVPRDGVEIPTTEAVTAAIDADAPARDPAREPLRRAIWSGDRDLALRAAAALDETEIDVVEAERVMELTLPEGVREGSPVKFGRLRSIVGSSELGALISYVALAEELSAERKTVYSQLHRIVRAEHMPLLCWLERNHPPARFEDAANDLYIAWQYTAQHARVRLAHRLERDPGPTHADLARAIVKDLTSDEEYDGSQAIGQPDLWVLNSFHPDVSDVPALLELSLKLLPEVEQWSHRESTLIALVRALSRVRTPEVGEFLQLVVAEGSAHAAVVARGGLARMGDSASIVWLIERSRTSEEAQTVLLEFRPRTAGQLLRTRLTARDLTADDVLFADLSSTAVWLGATIGLIPFEGLAEAIAASPPPTPVLISIFLEVPGCQTPAIAREILRRAEEDPPSIARREMDGEDEPDTAYEVVDPDLAALLHSMAPKAFTEFVDTLSSNVSYRQSSIGQWAAWAQMRLGAPNESTFRWLDRVKSPVFEELPVHPAVEAWLVKLEQREDTPKAVREGALLALAVQWGWPAENWLTMHEVGESWPAVERAIRARDWDALTAALRKEHWVPTSEHDSAVWKDVARLAVQGDAAARAGIWSAFRNCRYRWVHYEFEVGLHSLGEDVAVWPHWVDDLESNCCRVSDGLANDLFEMPHYEFPDIWGTESQGVGRSLSETTRMWFTLYGGPWQPSPLLDDYRRVRAPR